MSFVAMAAASHYRAIEAALPGFFLLVIYGSDER
jgi:hypothetical protein